MALHLRLEIFKGSRCFGTRPMFFVDGFIEFGIKMVGEVFIEQLNVCEVWYEYDVR